MVLVYGASQKGYRSWPHQSYTWQGCKVWWNVGIEKEKITKYVHLEVEELLDFDSQDEPSDTTLETSTREQQPNTVAQNTSEVEVRRRTWITTETRLHIYLNGKPRSQLSGRGSPGKWQNAMKAEMDSLYSNEVWELVTPPPNRKIVGSKWNEKLMRMGRPD